MLFFLSSPNTVPPGGGPGGPWALNENSHDHDPNAGLSRMTEDLSKEIDRKQGFPPTKYRRRLMNTGVSWNLYEFIQSTSSGIKLWMLNKHMHRRCWKSAEKGNSTRKHKETNGSVPSHNFDKHPAKHHGFCSFRSV